MHVLKQNQYWCTVHVESISDSYNSGWGILSFSIDHKLTKRPTDSPSRRDRPRPP